MMAEAMDLNVAFQTFDGTTCSRPGDIRVVASGEREAGAVRRGVEGDGRCSAVSDCPVVRCCPAGDPQRVYRFGTQRTQNS